jgi:alkanesulfonate monooxygenase SsuD/methylene tetrahydromethanopterin reductase-like flavin-dependent oxidoreductase (luciferase family)
VHKAVKLFLILSESWTMTDARDLRRLVGLAAVAEAAGIDGVMLGEHVAMGPNSAVNGAPENPRDWLAAGNQPPAYPHPSSLAVLSAMAAVTSKLRLLAGAVLTTLRPPLLLAKELATIDLISNGRLIFIPGLSWQREEYAAMGADFAQRGKMLDEQLEIWNRLWTTGSPVSFDGRFYKFTDMYLEPAPFRAGGPELWVGGRKFGPWLLPRTVRYAKGFFPVLPPTDDELQQLREAMAAGGRNIAELEIGGFLFGPGFTNATGLLDLDAALAPAAGMARRGFTTLVIKPSQYIDDAVNLGDFCRTALRKLADVLEP